MGRKRIGDPLNRCARPRAAPCVWPPPASLPRLSPTLLVATLLQRIGLAGSAVVLLLALVANAVAGLGAVGDQRAAFDEMYQAQRLLRRITLLRLALSDAETGQRGFLLTDEASYLEPFASGRQQAFATLDSLDLLARPFPDKAAAMPHVRQLVAARLSLIDSTVALAEAGRDAEALAIVRGGTGKAVMDSLRAVTGRMEAGALARRDRDLVIARKAGRRAVRTIAVANGALMLLMLALGWQLRRTLRERARASADLARANGSLSQALAERESALASVQAMQAQVVQQEKLAGLGRLTAGVAHELKNPLNFVGNFAQLADELAAEAQAALNGGRAADAAALVPDLRLNTAKVIEHAERADEIVRTMLVHARGVSGERQAVALDPVLAQAAEQGLGPADLRPVQVDRTGTEGVEVWGVPSALARLFTNLVENAADAVRERAGLTDDASFEPTVHLTVRRSFDRLGRRVAFVTVEDNGPGIPDATLPRIFEPFYTTKAPGQGTGLGLSLAYDIAVGHGGTLVAGRSGRLGGACFTVTLPTERPPDVPDADLAMAAASGPSEP